MPERPVLLFACIHNGGRSLAAKVLAEHHGQGRVVVRSAGSEPGDGLNPGVVQVLHERGLSTQGERPTLLTRDGVVEADVVVTMGCGEACPAVPGKRIVDWPLRDPKDQPLEVVREVVAEVEVRVLALLAELGLPVSAEVQTHPVEG